MKSEKIKTELTEIYKELAYQRALLENLMQEVKELKASVTPKTEYVHPWYEIKKQELIDSGNFVA